jgi:hypothetical protein
VNEIAGHVALVGERNALGFSYIRGAIPLKAHKHHFGVRPYLIDIEWVNMQVLYRGFGMSVAA